MSREHYDFCLRRGTNGSDWEECNCYEFDRALGWVSPYLREQIAKEIPELVIELKAYWNEQSEWDGFSYITDENFERILNFVAAVIARGEK